MKTKTRRRRLFSLAVTLALGFVATARAKQPRGTTMTGIVKAVDHKTRWITFAQDRGPLRQFVYSSRTQFWHHGAEELPARLLPGMRIQIQLHHPLIGPDFVRHIMLLTQPATPASPH